MHIINHTASLSRRMSKCLVGVASESKMGKMVDTQVSEEGQGEIKSRSEGRFVHQWERSQNPHCLHESGGREL
jgi:hypothetical protein